MPFDGSDFPAGGRKPRRTEQSTTMATVIIVILALSLLVVPVSMGALVDIVQYLRAR